MPHPELLLVVTSAEEAQVGVLVAHQIATRSGFCLRVLVASESAERVKSSVEKQYAELLAAPDASASSSPDSASAASAAVVKADEEVNAPDTVDLSIDCLGTDVAEVVAYINAQLTLRLVIVAGLQNWSDLRSAIFEYAHSSVACFESHPDLRNKPSRFHLAQVTTQDAATADNSIATWLAEHWSDAALSEFDLNAYLVENRDSAAALNAEGGIPNNEQATSVQVEKTSSNPTTDQTNRDVVVVREGEDAGGTSVIVLVADRNRLSAARKISRRVMAEAHPPVVVVRGEFPWLHYWLHAALPEKIAKLIPQMDRETRRTLADSLTTYSKLDFEFIALICASTFLASFGLVQNSAAVIIGAMLVAPLMTPILGAGLSLAQGNRPLFSASLKTIVVGFCAALLTSALFGCLLRLTPNSFLHREGQDVWLTAEMWSRTTPGVIDFLVGAVGGAAAAFARTRGHLSSALAGAAIAAALVPPIATSGLQVSLVAMNVYEPDGEQLAHNLIYGPALLFVANMLTIMIGASLVLWACGVRSETQYSLLHRWSTRMIMLLFLLTAIVAVWIVQNP
ncbi:MAG TPA: hypothetical protein DDW52_03880 [Planctomycetaceae bacterium]|nr:hypothetical protein [Planctomycetaceae bacterium]